MAIKVTLDTNVIEQEPVRIAAARNHMEVAVVTVTARELGQSPYRKYVHHVIEVPETGVWDESQWGHAVWGSNWNADILGEILRIITNGSFPHQGVKLNDGQRRQLRDAMILEAHARESRDIFVTNDQRAYVAHGRRQRFEELLETRILTGPEFVSEFGS